MTAKQLYEAHSAIFYALLPKLEWKELAPETQQKWTKLAALTKKPK